MDQTLIPYGQVVSGITHTEKSIQHYCGLILLKITEFLLNHALGFTGHMLLVQVYHLALSSQLWLRWGSGTRLLKWIDVKLEPVQVTLYLTRDKWFKLTGPISFALGLSILSPSEELVTQCHPICLPQAADLKHKKMAPPIGS